MSKIDIKKIEDIHFVNDKNVLGFFKKYRFLSNFHQCQVWFEGLRYPSSENAYQAAKIEPIYRINLVNCSPAESKHTWKEYPTLYRDYIWDEIKFNIMTRIVMEKFLAHPNLLTKLLNTDDRYLEETNYWNDTFWGVYNHKGENNLGKILMHVRDSQNLDKSRIELL